ncbi:MAG: hypothetical protein V3S82_04560 [Dehalococcoidia bacterium]
MDNNCNLDIDEGDVSLGVCGNGVIDAGEACDDGNNVDDDGCSAVCTFGIV